MSVYPGWSPETAISAIPWSSKTSRVHDHVYHRGRDIAASEAAKEAIWLHRMTANFSATSRIDHPALTVYCNSQSAIHLLDNPVYHAKTKHIEVRYHHIQELVTEKKLEVWKIDTEVNIID